MPLNCPGSLIDPEELKALRIESTGVLDLERFVDAATIDRIYWDEPYYLAPSEKTGVEAFVVILEAMREKKRVGIGKLVLNMRERICALEPRDNRILLTTLRTHEDIVAASDVGGITELPKPARRMLDIAEKIIERAVQMGIPAEDVVIDPLVMAVGSDSLAGKVTLHTVELVREKLGANINLGASNVSFGLPDRPTVNMAFLALAMGAGATCAITDPMKYSLTLKAIDLLRGRDSYGAKYLKYYRAHAPEKTA
mgnify:CR=1 FL=1